MNRRGKNPFEDISLLLQYFKIIRNLEPDYVLSYTVKCNLYGGLACKALKVPFAPNITGLGKGLSEGGLTSIVTKLLYKVVCSSSKCVFFQNESDKLFFDSKRINYRIGNILPGSGVNLKEYKLLKYPEDKIIKFLYMARVMKAKGIDEFIDAATYYKDNKMVEFHVCGYCEEDYIDKLNHLVDKNILIYHGLVKNTKYYYEMCSCLILPTYHPEGISNVLLEAAASGRPIITTNRPGCKEVVKNNVNGFLINEKDSADLIDRIDKLIKMNVKERRTMGEEGRKFVESCFDREIVVKEYLRLING